MELRGPFTGADWLSSVQSMESSFVDFIRMLGIARLSRRGRDG